MKKLSFVVGCVALIVFAGNANAQTKPLTSRVNEAFRSVYAKNPVPTENTYWLGRVVRGEKKTYESLRGAMLYHKALGQTIGSSGASAPASTSVPASSDKQTLIVNTLPLFVQIYGSDPANAEKAWWRKRISCGELTSQAALTNSMKFHKSKGARKGSDNICGQTAASGSTAAGGGVIRKNIAGVSTHPFGDHIRVGIFKTDGRAIHVTSNGSYQIREGASKILGTLGKDDVVQVSWSDGKYHVRGSGVSFDTANQIRLVPLNMAVMEVVTYDDPSPTIPGKNYNRFRGVIEIRKCSTCGELWAINELQLEYYLRGLAETSGTGPEEYIKALGTAARTYALYHKVVTGGRNPAKGYDITNTADDQLYRGYEYEIITPRMSNIFNQTKGIVVTDGQADSLVTTVYFSDSDGRTRSAKEVWNTSRFPHLQHSVKDPHHNSSSCRGHCVGMSAQGAFGFAKADDWSFQKILSYYFKGVKLVKAY
ncbi:MAG: SpoIID/LytB domain-containing protein [Candidatus Andersenbacteria bacterium]